MRYTAISGAAAALAVALGLSVSGAQALTLEEYLGQVRGQNLGYLGATEQATAAGLQGHESALLFGPTLFAEARGGHEGKPANPPLFQYDRVDNETWSAGVAQQFRSGLQAKLYYQLQHTDYINSPQLSGEAADFYDAAPVIELSMPLWGNGFGRAARANEAVIAEGRRAEQLGARALSQATLVQAEAAYWNLVAAREAVAIQSRAFDAAQAILDYVTNRNRMNLGDKADVLQAQALVDARRLELHRADSNAKSALRGFNAQRQAAPEADDFGGLDPLPVERLKQLTLPEQRPGGRYDVEAAGAQTEAAAATAQLAEERAKPTLDLYGYYAQNGRAGDSSTAQSDSLDDYSDTAFVGVRFSIPLDRSAANDAQAGARLNARAQRTLYVRRQDDQERDWTELRRRAEDARESLLLAEAFKSAQQAKLANERARLKQGRTTTYQVLLFEQDFSQAELTYVQVAAQLLSLEANTRFYAREAGQGN